MKITAAQKIKTGIFVMAALAILILGIFLIGKRKSLFSNTFSVYANFRTVAGLQIGNNVRFAGINMGTVDNITIVNDSTVRVDLLLQSKLKPYIKTDSKAKIGSDGLMGDKMITILSGSDSVGLVKNGGQIVATDPMEMDKIIDKVNGIADNAQVITKNLAEIFTKANNGKGTFGKLLNDDKLAENLENTINSTRQTVSNINKTAVNANEGIEAAKHNILLRGYFKKKEKQRIADSTKRADSIANVKAQKKKQ
jgi:phospholipid/cholesterol/gamma-HCH transport system substrate-binding protein